MKLDGMSREAAREALTHCCGASRWVESMLAKRPYRDFAGAVAASDQAFEELSAKDWLEAFTHHPKIGDLESLKRKYASTAHLAGKEQSGVRGASEATIKALAEGNAAYERKFGFIFIVCATGKSADEMLGLLQERMANGRETEIDIAAGEQKKITRLRLEKLEAAN